MCRENEKLASDKQEQHWYGNHKTDQQNRLTVIYTCNLIQYLSN
jgi:hypothetical protein